MLSIFTCFFPFLFKTSIGQLNPANYRLRLQSRSLHVRKPNRNKSGENVHSDGLWWLRALFNHRWTRHFRFAVPWTFRLARMSPKCTICLWNLRRRFADGPSERERGMVCSYIIDQTQKWSKSFSTMKRVAPRERNHSGQRECLSARHPRDGHAVRCDQ